MAKKTFIVTYECQTRVIVDVPENVNGNIDMDSDNFNDGLYDEIELKAEENILPCAQKYICIDNSSIVEDKDNPYDPETDETKSDIDKTEHTFEHLLHELSRKRGFKYDKCEDSNGDTYYEVVDKDGDEETPETYYPTKESLKEFISKYE